MQDDYWQWRLQATARREVMRMGQILGQVSSLGFEDLLSSRQLIRVLEYLSETPASQQLEHAVERLTALESHEIGSQLQSMVAHQEAPLRRLGEVSLQLFQLAVAGLERRQQLIDTLRHELAQLQEQLEELRHQSLEVLEPAVASVSEVPALTGVFTQQMEWVQTRLEQTTEQLRYQEQKLDEAQRQARTLELSLYDKQHELRLQEYKRLTQRRSLRNLEQRHQRLQRSLSKARQQAREAESQRSLLEAQLKGTAETSTLRQLLHQVEQERDELSQQLDRTRQALVQARQQVDCSSRMSVISKSCRRKSSSYNNCRLSFCVCRPNCRFGPSNWTGPNGTQSNRLRLCANASNKPTANCSACIRLCRTPNRCGPASTKRCRLSARHARG